tara:strand:- start:4761 stop:4922 length:162 start_codon:yes stop_codon:yes gene_type:complete
LLPSFIRATSDDQTSEMLGYLEMEPLPKAIATIADFQESEKSTGILTDTDKLT